MTRRKSLTQIFVIPTAIACVSAIGLIAALIGDGVWDAIGWLGLGVPLGVIGWCALRPRNVH